MKINADVSQRAVVHSEELDWVSSPMPGVERRMLERDGEEVARATSVVRYAKDSAFSAHIHGGGEEYIVLDGTFSDDTGDFPKGMYVRNPPGSRHTPSSAEGCTIFVKLWQMPPEDQVFVHKNLNDAENWQKGREGEQVMELHQSVHEHVRFLRWQAGCSFEEVDYPSGAEFFVLEGGFSDENGRYEQGSWLRLPSGSQQKVRTDQETVVYVKTGHLDKALPEPH